MPIPPSSLHYTVGPVIALVVILLIVVFLRWAFGGGGGAGSRSGRGGGSRFDPFAAEADATGLLQPVATLPERDQALALRAVLSDAGIRSTIRDRGRGGVQVLTFPADAGPARSLAGPFATPQ